MGLSHDLVMKLINSFDLIWMSRSADHHPAFFAVYNMETTEVIAFYQNSAEELYLLFEQFCDHFHATSSLSTTFITSHSNNIYALEQLRCNKSKANGFQQFVKKMLASLPFNCQSQSPSPSLLDYHISYSIDLGMSRVAKPSSSAVMDRQQYSLIGCEFDNLMRGLPL
ncbi:hypothetical protein C3L33_05255, partial [Rhododendron williamsianum]